MCSRKLRFPDFMTTAQEGGKVVSLTHRPHLPPGYPPSTHFCQRLSRHQGHSVIGRIMSMKNSNDTFWIWTSDLLICSTAPEPLCHRGPLSTSITLVYLINKRSWNSVVSTVTALQAGCHKNCGFITSRDFYFCLQSISASSGPTQCVMAVCFPRIKWLGHEADHALSFSAKC